MAKKGKKQMSEEISLNQYPSIYYKKFFDKFSEIDVLSVDDWQGVHIISYFCKRYEQYYGVKYSFKFNSTAPNKSYEVFQFRKLASMLSASPNILKDYIDYFFETKIMVRKKRITSMAYLTDANIVNDYKFKKLLIGKQVSIDRSTIIPPTYTVIIQKYGLNFSNYGELSFLKKCIDAGNGKPEYNDMLNELSKLGLDVSMLDRVK
jgi:hypothetical protein